MGLIKSLPGFNWAFITSLFLILNGALMLYIHTSEVVELAIKINKPLLHLYALMNLLLYVEVLMVGVGSITRSSKKESTKKIPRIAYFILLGCIASALSFQILLGYLIKSGFASFTALQFIPSALLLTWHYFAIKDRFEKTKSPH